jgi:signal transduction histidine kinase
MLVFLGPRGRWPRGGFRRSLFALGVPLAALIVAIALAAAFALIAGGSNLSFRLVSVVGVGVFSVIVSHVVSPRSAVIYLFLVAMLSAAWLSTEVAPPARIEFALQICIFLVAAFAMIHLSMEKSAARIAVANRRLRIRELAEQRDTLNLRIGRVEAEFAEIAHEFRTPLGGILGLIEIAEGGVASDRAQVQLAQYLRHMRGCARYLHAMVDDAFDIARMARGQFEPVIEAFDLADLLDELALISRSKHGGQVAFPDETAGLRLMARTDRNRLLQILINLVVNAVRYADRRGSVRVICAASPESVTISVENASSSVTGPEIDARLAGGQGAAANSQGLGIGLPLVGRLSAGIGARVSTDVADGLVRISVTVPRA